MPSLSRIQLIDRARRRIGSGPLQTENAPGAASAIDIYNSVTDDLFSRYPWSFGKKKRQLNRLGQAPTQHWKYRFARPTDLVGVPRAVFDSAAEHARPTTDYELLEDALHANAPALWMLYPISQTPALWPGFFVELVTLALMAEFALSVREDAALRKSLRQDVYGDPREQGEGGMLGQAKALDTQGQPSPVMAQGWNPLVDIRRG